MTRSWLRELADGKRFCNLFAYTGTRACTRPAGGSDFGRRPLDLSTTYVDWTRRNLAKNGFGGDAPPRGPCRRAGVGRRRAGGR